MVNNKNKNVAKSNAKSKKSIKTKWCQKFVKQNHRHLYRNETNSFHIIIIIILNECATSIRFIEFFDVGFWYYLFHVCVSNVKLTSFFCGQKKLIHYSGSTTLFVCEPFQNKNQIKIQFWYLITIPKWHNSSYFFKVMTFDVFKAYLFPKKNHKHASN